MLLRNHSHIIGVGNCESDGRWPSHRLLNDRWLPILRQTHQLNRLIQTGECVRTQIYEME